MDTTNVDGLGKECKAYGQYLVFSDGRVYRPSTKRFVGKREAKGYMCFLNSDTGKINKIHRAVASLFVPNPNNLNVVNHLDGDKTNNNFTNLEWVTCSQNSQHAFDTGLSCYEKGNWVRPLYAFKEGVFAGEFKSVSEACRMLSLTQSKVWDVLNGKKPKTKGYTFEYVHRGPIKTKTNALAKQLLAQL